MGKPLRVLQVGMSQYYGGTEAFVMNQYRKIDRDLVQFDFLNVYAGPLACEDEIRALGGQIYPLNMSRRQGLRQYKKNLDAFFRDHADKFDVIHCNFQSLINIDLLKYAKKYKIPGRIAHAHNAGYGREPGFLQKCLIKLNKITLPRYATTYFACSSLAGEWMFGHKHATVIHNAIDVEKFLYNEETRQRLRREIGVENDRVILFVGRLDPQKNPTFLPDVFREIIAKDNGWRLWIVGDGILRGEVEDKIEAYDLGDRISLLGSRSDVNDLMQAADAFLLPSNFEGLGIVLIEAQAASLPCFTSKDVVPAEVDVTGLVNFIPLGSGADRWAEAIQDATPSPRTNRLEEIRTAGYESQTSIGELEENYVSLAKKYTGAAQ